MVILASVLAAILFFQAHNAVAFAPGASLAQRGGSTKSHDQVLGLVGLPLVTGQGLKTPRTTGLAMGLDEFLTGRDDKTRKADNDKYVSELRKRKSSRKG
jgi:hypothetical protein